VSAENSPAFVNARRSASSLAFHSGHACGQISNLTSMSADPAAAAIRVASDSNVSADPTKAAQIREQRRDQWVLAIDGRGHIRVGQFAEVTLVDNRIDGFLGVQRGPSMVRSVHVQSPMRRPVKGLIGLPQAVDQSDREISAGAIAGHGNLVSRNALSATKRHALMASSCAAR
jgi:hypothetical protein